jgi:hypothetical protein
MFRWMVIPPEIPQKKRISMGLVLAFGMSLGLFGVIQGLLDSHIISDYLFFGTWLIISLVLLYWLYHAWRNRNKTTPSIDQDIKGSV